MTGKVCIKCGELKPIEDFYRHRSTSDRRQSKCKKCHCAYTSEYYMRKTYGITRSDFDRMLEKQGGGCRICGTVSPGPHGFRLAIDHDHDTGEVRGLLCAPCNSLIAYARESVAILDAAISYLVDSGKDDRMDVAA